MADGSARHNGGDTKATAIATNGISGIWAGWPAALDWLRSRASEASYIRGDIYGPSARLKGQMQGGPMSSFEHGFGSIVEFWCRV